MRTKWAAMTLFVAGSLLVPTAGFAWNDNAKTTTGSTTESVKQSAEDAAITTKVKAAHATDGQVSALRIHVDTKDGVVTLTGSAKTKAEADKAVSDARAVEGVTSVENRIHVGAKSDKY